MAQWTEARLRSFIVSALRSATRRWPTKFVILEEAKTEKKKNKKSGRIAQHYRCNVCNEEFPGKEISVDHIIPVVGEEGFTTWDNFIKRLFCDKENLQAICSTCHDAKSKAEKEQRKNARKQNS